VTEYTAPTLPPLRPTDAPIVRDPPERVPDLGALASNENVAGTPELPQRQVVERDPPQQPPREVVRIAARLISGDLQPPYPASEQRMDREGRVVIRVTIGPDGRVTGTDKVSATSDAFYQATARHARARWRFSPARVDGQPVESTSTMTVVFRLDG
jgi:protein TonB